MMGVKSTFDISREQAIASILQAVDGATNEQLADALEALVGDEFMANYRIVETSKEKDDGRKAV